MADLLTSSEIISYYYIVVKDYNCYYCYKINNFMMAYSNYYYYYLVRYHSYSSSKAIYNRNHGDSDCASTPDTSSYYSTESLLSLPMVSINSYFDCKPTNCYFIDKIIIIIDFSFLYLINYYNYLYIYLILKL